MRGVLDGVSRNIYRLKRWLQRRYFPTTLDKILAVPGWTFESQLLYSRENVRALPDSSCIVEIGVWQGRSALSMADACRGTSKKIFAIDPWQDYVQGDKQVSSQLNGYGVHSFDEVYDAFFKNRQELHLESWVIPRRMTSDEAAKEWHEGPVGMIFIDGNHDYNAVMADLNAWVPHMLRGGLVCGDDWNWGTVQTAVKDFTSHHPEYQLKFPCDNTWTFRA